MSPPSGTGPGILILACGNPSRGDDALGPVLIDRVSAIVETLPGAGRSLELMTDYQLQIEHALDLQGRALVVFVDAALSGPEPFGFAPVTPAPALSITTHALSPGGLLRVFVEAVGGPVPDCRLLAIRGYRFELGAGLSTDAGYNLLAAERFLLDWLWDQSQSHGRLPAVG